MALPIIGGIITAVGGMFKGLFNWKGEQAKTVQSALQVLSDSMSSDSQRAQAVAHVIASESMSDSWLTRMWRPFFMVVCMALVLAYWFGYHPENLKGANPPIVQELFDLLKIGVMGYIPSRTLEKIVDKFQIGNVLKTFISKKLV